MKILKAIIEHIKENWEHYFLIFSALFRLAYIVGLIYIVGGIIIKINSELALLKIIACIVIFDFIYSIFGENKTQS